MCVDVTVFCVCCTIWTDINIFLFIIHTTMSQACFRGFISNGTSIHIVSYSYKQLEITKHLCYFVVWCGVLTGVHQRRSSAQSNLDQGNFSFVCSFSAHHCIQKTYGQKHSVCFPVARSLTHILYCFSA